MKSIPTLTITEFNQKFKTNYQGTFEINQFTDYLETQDLSYLYTSMCLQDVLGVCEEEQAVPAYDVVYVEGWYLALR